MFIYILYLLLLIVTRILERLAAFETTLQIVPQSFIITTVKTLFVNSIRKLTFVTQQLQLSQSTLRFPVSFALSLSSCLQQLPSILQLFPLHFIPLSSIRSNQRATETSQDAASLRFPFRPEDLSGFKPESSGS